jgi:hypothetical protein
MNSAHGIVVIVGSSTKNQMTPSGMEKQPRRRKLDDETGEDAGRSIV